ncbi:MFS transporter [Thermomonospora cellulosilytica]|uniref:Putative MFS family arabinose efflux permease n=1 Tax=Thermomonospora cellulosilytica TaxID=1411118 RepID=A0A7W3MVP2_9ACTN|nr:MFS transporter [Thermomonospora cellulosilytica]MBA9002689.1 putative MFS family arabinose efflux permease [Thermomonospora cellulosilytica]
MTVSPSADAGPNRRIVAVLAITCGVAVSNIYFVQAISPLIAADLKVAEDSAAAAVTAAQFGYAAGNFLLVPLGDRIPHRTLIVALLGLTGLGLAAAAAAPGLPMLIAASAAVGITTVVAQVIAPMAAGLVTEERRGAVMGVLLSGSIGGILLSRAFGGVLGEWLGWRAPYAVAAALAFLLAAVLAVVLPVTVPATRERYPALLAEPLRLLRAEPELRRSCFYQATVFGGFQAVWTGLALLLTGPGYDLSAPAVGVIALVSAVTMVCMPWAGRQVDRRGSDPVNLAAIAGTLTSAAVLAAGGLGGAAGLAALTAGVLLLDVAMQSGMIANQARIFTLRPDSRSRLNTAYMTCAFLGGSVGSWLGTRAYARVGWAGVCGLVAVLAGLALLRHLPHARRAGR